MISADEAVQRTRNWVTRVVVGCNFCPFAAREVRDETIRYSVDLSADGGLEAFKHEIEQLDADGSIATTMLILPNACADLYDYLDLVADAEDWLLAHDYEGVYQIASFHPLYRFDDTAEDDPANYTNRSVYPMLHILREDSIDAALERYADPEGIPQRNIDFARQHGLEYMRTLQASC